MKVILKKIFEKKLIVCLQLFFLFFFVNLLTMSLLLKQGKRVLVFAAHPIDILLFFNPDVYGYIKDDYQITTVFFTSSDAGNLSPYWKNIEERIKSSYALMSNQKNSWEEKILTLSKFKLKKFTLKRNKKINLIFMRLPDGGFNGKGFPANNYQSLMKLWFSEINQIQSLDKQNTYNKNTLIKTIEKIISLEKPEIILIQDSSNYKSTNDHSDRYIGAYLSLKAIKNTHLKNKIKLVSYFGNIISFYKKNLNLKQTDIKKKLFLNYDIIGKEEVKKHTQYLYRQYKKELKIGKIKKLPKLYTYENKILNEEDHTPFVLKGASTQFFGYHIYDFEKFKKIYFEIKKQRINLIGCFINLENTYSKINYLDWLVDETEKDKIYLYITPTVNGRIVNHLPYTRNFPNLMGKVAQRYQNKNHIIFGVWSEPHSIDWESYITMVNKTIINVRQYKPKALILITGIDWGAIFKNVEQLKKIQNIILNFHYYPKANKEELKQYLLREKIEFPWENFTNQFPIIIGEFGGVWREDFSSEEDLEYIKLALENINKHKLSYTFYTLDNEPGQNLIDHYSLIFTRKGQLLINDIKTFPPTKL